MSLSKLIVSIGDEKMFDSIRPRVLIMAGGTGGHVFPALAVADKLRQSAVDLSWLGTLNGIEADLVPSHGIPINYIEIEGIRGKGVKALFKAPYLLCRSMNQAFNVLKDFRPDVVLGMGGFVSGPGAMAARIKDIPIVVHEQNAIAGTTNRILSKFANSVLEGFPSTLRGASWVGNPVRSAITRLATPENRMSSRKGPVKLLVLGGRRGSQAINELVPAAVSTIGVDQRPSILHQTGKSNLKMTRALYSALDIEAEVTEFIDAIEDAYEWADFVICRSGALTVAELTSVGLGSILIPFPYAIDDHQTANARLLEANGAAVIYQQSELTFELLGKLIIKFAIDPCNRLDMAMAARKLAKNNAADQVAKTCLEYFNAKA